ncbi:hypothetical protein Lser_V15G08215 [Lactuca serriola]
MVNPHFTLNMLGLKSHQISSIQFMNPNRKLETDRRFVFQFLPNDFSYLQLKSRRKNSRGFKVSSSEDSNGNGDGKEDLRKEGGGGDEVPRVNLRWSELLLDPDPDNVVAVGLTGALAWAGVQVLRQLFVATMATLMAGVKYTFMGVFLIFIVVTLL